MNSEELSLIDYISSVKYCVKFKEQLLKYTIYQQAKIIEKCTDIIISKFDDTTERKYLLMLLTRAQTELISACLHRQEKAIEKYIETIYDMIINSSCDINKEHMKHLVNILLEAERVEI